MKKKYLLIFPPQAHPANPYLALPLLAGQLRRAGKDVSCLDLNVLFFNEILTRKYLESTLIKIKEILKSNDTFDIEKYKLEQKRKILELLKREKVINYTLENIEKAVSVFKSEKFYNPKQLVNAIKIISFALNIVSICYYPCPVTMGEMNNPFFSYSWSDVKKQTKNRNINIFVDYFEEKILALDINKYDIVGVSVAFPNQIVPAFTLLRLLKEKTNAKVLLGGNLVNRIDNIFSKYTDIFDDYCDYILSGDGENSIVKFAEFAEGKEQIENVNGLIYRDKKNNIIRNQQEIVKNLDEIAPVYLDDYNLKDYFIPEIVFPLQSSKGCYWGKCVFCDFFHGKPHYYIKTPELLISEIISLNKKYGIRKFEFTDEAISPNYYSRLADEIIKNNLDIAFFSMARLETEFSEDLLRKMHKAGLKLINWGYEASSERIMNMMNKGIDSSKRIEILRRSANAKIWNRVSYIIGFPTETKEEAQMTVDTVRNNIDIMDSYNVLPFLLRKHAIITNEQSRYKILYADDKNELLDEYEYKESEMSFEEKDEYRKQLIAAYNDNGKIRLWRVLMPNSYLISYLDMYSKEFVRDYRI